MQIELEWRGEGSRFVGEREGVRTEIDGSGTAGASPVALLLEALAACSAADVVEILHKGRQELRGLRVTARGERRPEPPRYFTRIELLFRIAGAVERKKAERAVELSLGKYCSVSHTLRRDLDLEWSIELEGETGSA